MRLQFLIKEYVVQQMLFRRVCDVDAKRKA